jgi:hypothetical protein
MISLPGFMCLYEFTVSDSDVFRSEHLPRFIGGGHAGAPLARKFAQRSRASGSLMDGQGGLVGEQLFVDAGDLEVVVDICRHVFIFEGFQMASADDPGSQGLAGVEHQLIDEVVLSCQDDGQQRFGIHVELA